MAEVHSNLTHIDPKSFDLEHLSPSIGTVVNGIDISNVDSTTIDWLAELLVERKVIFFRDQDVPVEAHIAFARQFGELEVHPFYDTGKSDHAEVIRLDNDRENPPYINVWHSDVTWRAVPSLGSILRARVVPAVGGDTLFANMEGAYKGLDDETKARIDGLYAIHDNEGFLRGMRMRGASEEEIDAKRREFPPQRHPVVRTHPVSGRKSLYVNRAFTRSIEGMEPNESAKLLETLYLKAWLPEYQCRFQWRRDSFAFWDNRAAQHYAVADYWPSERRMERVTIIGDRPR